MIYGVFIKYCVFSEYFKIFRALFSLGVSVYTLQAGKTPALQQNWQSSEKLHFLKKKHNI